VNDDGNVDDCTKPGSDCKPGDSSSTGKQTIVIVIVVAVIVVVVVAFVVSVLIIRCAVKIRKKRALEMAYMSSDQYNKFGE
jgi:heme/copper-type cytochrome/quinol oxidase subunit 2